MDSSIGPPLGDLIWKFYTQFFRKSVHLCLGGKPSFWSPWDSPLPFRSKNDSVPLFYCDTRTDTPTDSQPCPVIYTTVKYSKINSKYLLTLDINLWSVSLLHCWLWYQMTGEWVDELSSWWNHVTMLNEESHSHTRLEWNIEKYFEFNQDVSFRRREERKNIFYDSHFIVRVAKNFE